MDLLIRSQDKKQLAQIVGLLLDDENNEIRGFTNYHQNYYELGKYKTKERALEVLDEIQNIEKLKQAWQLDENSFQICIKKGGYDEEQVVALMNMMYVYEMPLE